MAPMITRGKDEDDTICHDAHTMALRRANRTHEFNTIMNLRKVFGHFFGMPKILPSLTKLLPKPEKLNRWSYDGFRCPHEWPDVYTIRPEFEHFHNRVSIWCQVRDSVTPALCIAFKFEFGFCSISSFHYGHLIYSKVLVQCPLFFIVWNPLSESDNRQMIINMKIKQ